MGCLTLLAAVAPAQTLVSSGSVLASARQDPAVLQQTQQIALIQQTNLRLPFVEQVGLRTETDRFELRRQEYLTRVSVNGIKEMNSQRRLQSSNLNLEESKAQVLLHEALLERYHILTEYRHAQREQDLRRQLALVFEDKIQVLQTLARLNADADLEEIVKAEYDRDEQSLKIAATESRLEQLRLMIQQTVQPSTTRWQLDTSDFISPQQVERVIGELPPSGLQNPELAEKQAKINQLDAEYRLKKAQSQQMLDFFQMRYANRPDEPFNRDLSVGVGINLPYKGSARLNTNTLKIEQNAATQGVQRYQADLAQWIEMARRQITALSQRLQLAKQQWQDSQARFSLGQSAAAGSLGPMPLLKARELQIQRELNLLDIERDMFSQYLKILDWTGHLSDTPAVNYLSANLDPY